MRFAYTRVGVEPLRDRPDDETVRYSVENPCPMATTPMAISTSDRYCANRIDRHPSGLVTPAARATIGSLCLPDTFRP